MKKALNITALIITTFSALALGFVAGRAKGRTDVLEFDCDCCNPEEDVEETVEETSETVEESVEEKEA